MGKVLIALCTVFLLAFPARGEQAVTWESLPVWNDLPPLYDPAPWPSDLAGKRVILRWNGKHNGDLLLDYLHSLLSRAFPGYLSCSALKCPAQALPLVLLWY